MSFSPYSEKQIQAAKYLLELFTPPEHSFEVSLAMFTEALADIDDEEAAIYALIHQALGKVGAFFAPEDDADTLIDSLKQLSEQWGANLIFGARDWEASQIEYHASAELLAIAALELRAYELCLWQWDAGDEVLTGFISRIADIDLIEKLSQQCGAELWLVEEQEI